MDHRLGLKYESVGVPLAELGGPSWGWPLPALQGIAYGRLLMWYLRSATKPQHVLVVLRTVADRVKSIAARKGRC